MKNDNHSTARLVGVTTVTLLLVSLGGFAHSRSLFFGGDGEFGGEEGELLSQMERIGDLDGDQIDDFIVLTTGAFDYGQGWHGLVSCPTSGCVPVRRPNPPKSNPHNLAVIGDYDGNGVEDYAIAYEGDLERPQFIIIYDGLSGAIISRIVDPEDKLLRFGADIVGLGDINLDGFDDVLVAGVGKQVYGFLGPDGNPAFTIEGPSTLPSIDALRDGTGGFVVGWPFDGSATVYSSTGAVLRQYSAPSSARELFGIDVAVVQRLAQEPYIAVGAPGYRVGGTGANLGRVYVFDTTSSSPVHTIDGTPRLPDIPEPAFGRIVKSGGAGGFDLDFDGVDEIIAMSFANITERSRSKGFASVLSGATGIEFDSKHAEDDSWEMFSTASPAGDLNGDLYPEWVVVDPTSDESNPEGGAAFFVDGLETATGTLGG